MPALFLSLSLNCLPSVFRKTADRQTGCKVICFCVCFCVCFCRCLCICVAAFAPRTTWKCCWLRGRCALTRVVAKICGSFGFVDLPTDFLVAFVGVSLRVVAGEECASGTEWESSTTKVGRGICQLKHSNVNIVRVKTSSVRIGSSVCSWNFKYLNHFRYNKSKLLWSK